MALRAASLFAGVGGLDLALKLAIPGAETVVYIERDSYSAATLVARMEDSTLDQAPVWDDITTFDGRPWRGVVDILIGGFPCQDISVAGKGAGLEGKRSGLWSEIIRLADEIRPRFIFLENVSAITSRGLDTVLADLAEGGFDAEWCCLRASEVGASHRRERWFCLAYRNLDRREGERSGGLLDGEWTPQRDDVDGCDEGLADATNERHERAGIARRRGRGSEDHSESVANPEGISGGGSEPERGSKGRVAAGGAGAVFPPGPCDYTHWRKTVTDGSFDFRAPAVKPGIRVLVDGLALVVDASRADQLRCSGNGVVALQASVALRELMRRAGLTGMTT